MFDEKHGWVCQTAFIRALGGASDRELLEQFQQQHHTGRYFIALVCRYERRVNEILEIYIPQSNRLNHYSRYVWQHCFRTWQTWDLRKLTADIDLDTWLQSAIPSALKQLAETRRGGSALPTEIASPLSVPLWCYLMQALETMPGDLRFILVLSDVFRWTPRQIAQQLTVEGYTLAETEAEPIVNRARGLLWQMLPSDIVSMYVALEAVAS
ncbi:MAG: hypothetical protein AAGB13_06330 [Cyanobacteria bacterium P01_F01_bin.33]